MGRNLMNSVPLGLSLPLGLKGLQCTQVGSTTATHTNINSNLAGMTNRPKLATNQSLILLKTGTKIPNGVFIYFPSRFVLHSMGS